MFGLFKNPQLQSSSAPGKGITIIVCVAMIVLLTSALLLTVFSEKEMRRMATEQFNEQQLLLARYAARQLEQNFELLWDELTLLNYSPSIQYLESVSWDKRMEMTMSILKRIGVISISRSDPRTRRVYSLDNMGRTSVKSITEKQGMKDALERAALPDNKGRIFVSPVFKDQERYPDKCILVASIPTYQDSVDAAHPIATGRFAGMTQLTLDVGPFVKRIMADIRSGRTGYAWVIDRRGDFLYHPLREFVSANAFEARARRDPKISFSRINQIQKEKMLAGKEGTSSYTSGWHRESVGTTEKLIAYTPVFIGNAPEKEFWSVAVVAPIAEVEEVVKKGTRRVHFLYGVIVLAIILVGLSAFLYERRWEIKLAQQVEEKTHSLRRSEERYRSLVENATDMIYSLDHAGHILSMNRYGVKRLAATEPEPPPASFEGRNFFSLASWGDLSPDTIADASATATPQTLDHTATIDDKQYTFSTHLIPVQDRTGEVRSLLGISRDITQQKQMVDYMANTEKLASLGLLAAGVAHEINNPIAIIMGFADVLLEKCPPGADKHDMLKRIIHQSQVCEKVVSQLLTFSRVAEYAEDITDINKEIEAIVNVVSNTLLMKRVKVKLDLQRGLPRVKADPKQVQQVFLNMINNAAGAMKGGGVLEIATESDTKNNRVQICFSDTGTGIAPEHRSKVFDPFFTTKKQGEGTGLGLTVTYNIITSYGGTITYVTKTQEEAGDEKGTTFIITLPAFMCQLK